MRICLFLSCSLLVAVNFKVQAQDVVSASSGVLQYFEGSVVIDDKPVAHQTAIFPSLKNSSSLQTNKGRAEILLTPGVYLRLDEGSGIRMVSNSLTETRIEMTRGTAIFDNVGATATDSVALAAGGSSITFPKPGVYRIDSDLGELQTYTGEAKVARGAGGAAVAVDSDHHYNFTVGMLMDKIGGDDFDEFYDWAHNRNEQISDKNQIASADQIDAQDPAAGFYAVPPLAPTPNYNFPNPGYSTLSSSTYAPLYVYQTPPYLGYAPYTSILSIGVIPVRLGTARWPGTGTVITSRPIVTRWPITATTPTHYPISPIHFPTGSFPTRPITTFAPRPAGTPNIPIPASRMATPHVSVGHR